MIIVDVALPLYSKELYLLPQPPILKGWTYACHKHPNMRVFEQFYWLCTLCCTLRTTTRTCSEVMGIQKHVSKRQLLMLLFLENLRHSLHWMRGTTVFYKDLHLRSFMTFISNAGYRNKFYKYESWNVHTFVSQNVFTARKTEGPRAYSCYIGSSARAEWQTFLPS